MNENTVSPRQYNPHLSARLEAIVLKLMHREPEHRFQNAREVLAALKYVEMHNQRLPPRHRRGSSRHDVRRHGVPAGRANATGSQASPT